ncbi:MAG: hypothetical protein ACI8WB_002400 [Phenylobacterium sp.]|jgi:hypothetical protein
MKVLTRTLLTLMWLCSCFANATYYIFDASDLDHPLGDVNLRMGWDNARVVYMNTEVSQWKPGDVVRITGLNLTEEWIYLSGGSWLKATTAQVQQAKADGTKIIVFEETPPPGGGAGGTPCALPTECDDEDGAPRADPLVIDLGQDGFHFAQAGVGVDFDFNGDGEYTSVQWFELNGNDAFLAIDLNDNGIVDHGAELFGTGSQLLDSDGYASHGFEALAQYDQPQFGGNDDGVIDASDKVWPKLSLWLDSNADGIATDEEMLTLAQYGITNLSVIAKQNNRQDPAGNWLPLWAWATNDNQTGNRKHKMVDVFFNMLD